MRKSTLKKLELARETVSTLSAPRLQHVYGGAVTDSAAPVKCEPSGILMCPVTQGKCL
jgi:hypothetical protein